MFYGSIALIGFQLSEKSNFNDISEEKHEFLDKYQLKFWNLFSNGRKMKTRWPPELKFEPHEPSMLYFILKISEFWKKLIYMKFAYVENRSKMSEFRNIAKNRFWPPDGFWYLILVFLYVFYNYTAKPTRLHKKKLEFLLYLNVAIFRTFKWVPYFEIVSKNHNIDPAYPKYFIFDNTNQTRSISY